MQFRQRKRKDIGIDISSLVDVVFLLLLFFVVTTTFRESPGMEIDLPETRDAEGVQLKDLIVTIGQKADGAHFFIDDEELSLDTLPDRLKAEFAKRQPEDRSIVVQADKNVRFEAVYQVFDISKNAGATSITVPAIYNPALANSR